MENDIYRIYAKEKKWDEVILDKNRIKEFEINYLPFIKNLKNSKILDVGSGQGFFLDFCKEHGFSNYSGIDINKDLINVCRKKGHKVVHDDISNFLIKTKDTFDIIVLNDILEHFKKDMAIKLLKMLKEKLNREGLIIIRVPNANYLFSAYYRYNDFTHETIYEIESLQYFLKLVGFDVLCKEFKTNSNNFIRRIIRIFFLKINQAFFLIYEGKIRPVEMNIFAVGKIRRF